MRQRVETYIKKCLNCQQNKHVTHVKYEKIQYMNSSKASWDEMFMNFIIKLSKSKNSTNEKTYDAILVMIDCLIKYCHIIFFKKIYNVEQLKYLVLNRFIRYQKISREFINDRDKLFTFNYWKTLLLMLGTKLKMSTTFHLQTNEQTKRANQSLKQYFKHYVNNTQFNWVKLLLMTQLTLNVKVSNTTKMTFFFRKFWKKIKPLWKIKKSNIDKSNNYKGKHNKDDTKKYIKNAKEFNDISKQKKENDIFTKRRE